MKHNLKDIIEQKLKDAGVGYRFIPLPEDLPPDIPSHAAFHGIKLANAMATILYRTEKGIIGATKRSDTQIDEEKLKKFAGVSQLLFASKEDLKKLGTEVGLVPYLGLNIRYFVDQKVLEIDQAYGTGGIKTMGMAMNSADLMKVNKGTVGDFTYFEEKKVFAGKRFLSGITPSGDGSLHIGNYLGAVRQFIELANPSTSSRREPNETYLMVADLHGLTTIQDKQQLSHNIETLVLNELALLRGFMTEKEFSKIVFFRQSDVPMHTECQSILNNVTPLGLLKRAHAYKDKLGKDVMEDDINVGLFSYPMLMAADILLYQPDLVPVGKDQKQHIEITRDIADRFNKIFKKQVFKLPEPYIPEEVAVVLGTDGKRKMSKSLGNVIALFEPEEVIKKQVMGTYTDPTRAHATDPGHVERNMVFTYLAFFGEARKVAELKERYKRGTVADVEVKEYLFKTLIKYFAPARKAYEELKANPALVKKILEDGAVKARVVASQTMTEVREAIGITNQYSISDKRPSFVKATEGRQVTGDKREKTITIDEFARVEERVGKVVEAKNVEGSEKLIRLVVDFADFGKRIIFTGVRTFGYTPEDFLGKQFLFVTNLAPRKMIDEESQGMILAVDPPSHEATDGHSGPEKPIFVSAEGMPVGAKIR
ncbi:tryptophan--tRNA ligase [Candidatus Gottesmanbacteria bacterium]|nr:tryptophan--tRNA ligase [Candidatus Gottesmanbacteria bacterium]